MRLLLFSVGLLFVSTPVALQGGLVQFWQLKELAVAPVLVVGRVVSVHQDRRAAERLLAWKVEIQETTAEVEVLRALGTSERRLHISFLSFGPSVTGFVNPPALPLVPVGDVLVFPLSADGTHLIAEAGLGLTIPVRAELPPDAQAPEGSRGFLLRELTNTLSRGRPREVVALSHYLLNQFEDLSGELMPFLEAAVGDDRQRWAEIAADLMASDGIPRPHVADLIAGDQKPLRGSLPIARTALRKLGASAATEEILIRTWMANVPLNAWGSANSLVEYAEHPVTTDLMRQALRDDLSGSSFVALVLIRAGNKALLPDAVARAFRVVDQPKPQGQDYTDLQGAAALLRDFGSDAELRQLAGVLKKYQTAEPKFYNLLWQYASDSGNLREVRVLAVVLADRRVISGDMRYCDYALGALERATGQTFGSEGKSIAERDAAVAKGLAWVKERGLLD